MRPIVAIDLDGVLASWEHGTFHEIGPPIPGAAEWTRRLSEKYDLIVYTCRATEELYKPRKSHLLANEVRAWLDAHGFVYHEVWTGQGKPMAHAYVDDRAVECVPERWAAPGVEFLQATVRIDELCGADLSTDIPTQERKEKQE